MKNNKKKLLIYKILFIILIITAIVIISTITKKQYDDQVYDNQNADVVDLFYEELNKQETITEVSENNDVQENKINIELNGHKVIGLIKIPAIDLEYPILEKTTKATMKIAISRFSGGEINQNGNVSLAGHNNYSGTMFGKNKYLKLGDSVFLTDLTSKTIEYEIYEIFVTDPNDTTVLETKDENIKEVTLITCKNGRSKRLIIKAKEKNLNI